MVTVMTIKICLFMKFGALIPKAQTNCLDIYTPSTCTIFLNSSKKVPITYQ